MMVLDNLGIAANNGVYDFDTVVIAEERPSGAGNRATGNNLVHVLSIMGGRAVDEGCNYQEAKEYFMESDIGTGVWFKKVAVICVEGIKPTHAREPKQLLVIVGLPGSSRSRTIRITNISDPKMLTRRYLIESGQPAAMSTGGCFAYILAEER